MARAKLPVRRPGDVSFSALRSAPHMFWGLPGVGKTAYFNRIADVCFNFIPSERLAVDLCAPVIVHKSDDVTVLRDAPHEWVVEANELAAKGKKVVILLDELTTASEDMEARMLSFINQRQVGRIKIDPRVAIVAAANPPDIVPAGRPLHLPTVSRMAHFWFEPALKTFGSDFASYWDSPPEVPGVDPGMWTEIRHDVGAFLMRNVEYVLLFPDIDKVDFSNVRTLIYPCPRSWDNFTRMVAANKLSIKEDRSSVVDILVSVVGDKPVTPFVTWFRNLSIPSLEEVLKNPRSFKIPGRIDSRIALAMRLALVSVEEAGPALAALTRIASQSDECYEFIRPAISRLFDKLMSGENIQRAAEALKFVNDQELKILKDVSKKVQETIRRVYHSRKRSS